MKPVFEPDSPIRFNELQRLMPKMTHATLSVQLKSLVAYGLVERKQYETIPPRVEYSLTEIGMRFHPVLEAMQKWGSEYIEYMKNFCNSSNPVLGLEKD